MSTSVGGGGGCSVNHRDSMSTSRDVRYIRGYHEYIGGYHEYIEGCSVQWGDIMIHLLNIPQCTHDIILMYWTPPDVLNTHYTVWSHQCSNKNLKFNSIFTDIYNFIYKPWAKLQTTAFQASKGTFWRKMHSNLPDLRNIKLPVTIPESSVFISYNFLAVIKWNILKLVLGISGERGTFFC